MKIQSLGHAVLKVRSLERAEAFYHGLLGLPVAAARPQGIPMVFFTLGNHHDFALFEVGEDAPAAPGNAPGLFHLAFKVGDTREELRAVKRELDAAGVASTGMDHTVTQSLYVQDPDGNTIELYVDGSDVWKRDPTRVADYAPLEL